MDCASNLRKTIVLLFTAIHGAPIKMHCIIAVRLPYGLTKPKHMSVLNQTMSVLLTHSFVCH